MKVGELYTPKEYSNYPENKDDDLFGYIIIRLVEYVGDDCWRFENLGTASSSIYWFPEDPRNEDILKMDDHNHIAKGSQIYEKYILLDKLP